MAFRAIGGGHSTASKFFSSLAWRRTTKTPGRIIQKKIEEEAKLLLEKELNRASRGVKEWKFSNGELNCSLACRESLFLLHVTCQSPIVREN